MLLWTLLLERSGGKPGSYGMDLGVWICSADTCVRPVAPPPPPPLLQLEIKASCGSFILVLD